MHIAFATSRAHATLTADDLLAASACSARDMRISPAEWDDPRVDWSSFDAVVIRSTWDYHHRAAEFDDWLGRLGLAGTPVWNPIPLLRWNANKRYLATLAERGVPTVPTVWATPARPAWLVETLDEQGWSDVVVKPGISATAHGTHRVRRHDAERIGRALHGDMPGREYLVQPFLGEIQRLGEWSLIFFHGRFSHSVRKRPADGDFRVQTEFGGSAIAEAAPRAVIDAAAAVLLAVNDPWLYARVDGIEIERGFLLMELEMLEPMLFFGRDAQAPARFAAALDELMTARSPVAPPPTAAPPR